MKNKIAVIGSGFSGIILSQMLRTIADVKVFEKARGVGGRMSSRSKDEFVFDFGTQFFIAKNPEFKKFLEPYIKKELIKPWLANFAEIDNYKITYQRLWNVENDHLVPVPKMNSLCKELAKNLDISFQTKVTKIQRINNKWQIFDEAENFLGEFDWIFFSIPSAQLSDLVPNNCSFYNQIQNFKMLGCFALMLGFNEKLELPFDVALIKNSIISWISSESSKPNRCDNSAYTILSRNSWTEQNIESDIEIVKQNLIDEFSKIINQKLPNIIHCDIHKWRFANIPKQKNVDNYFIDLDNSIGACGDWFIQGRVEAAYLSATRLFDQYCKTLY